MPQNQTDSPFSEGVKALLEKLIKKKSKERLHRAGAPSDNLVILSI